MKVKITTGFVIQKFDDDGVCLEQEFVAGDEVDWEDENGESLEDVPNYYHPMNMEGVDG